MKEQEDFDKDGIPKTEDPDDDNDGVHDETSGMMTMTMMELSTLQTGTLISTTFCQNHPRTTFPLHLRGFLSVLVIFSVK